MELAVAKALPAFELESGCHAVSWPSRDLWQGSCLPYQATAQSGRAEVVASVGPLLGASPKNRNLECCATPTALSRPENAKRERSTIFLPLLPQASVALKWVKRAGHVLPHGLTVRIKRGYQASRGFS